MRAYSLLLAGFLSACGDDEPSEQDAAVEDAATARVDAAMTRVDAAVADAAREPILDARVSEDAATRDATIEAVDAGAVDAGESVAAALDALTLEAPCAADTPLPLAKGATCLHAGSKLRLTQVKKLGGDPARVYEVRLRIRGVWEPTSIAGGMHDAKLPLTVGGEVAQGAGDPINYQQWFVQVAKPKQTYWLNDYRYVAHDIHREDYEATLRIQGGAEVTVVMNDGNDHQIANWTKDTLDGGTPATGQVLRIDVVSAK